MQITERFGLAGTPKPTPSTAGRDTSASPGWVCNSPNKDTERLKHGGCRVYTALAGGAAPPPAHSQHPRAPGQLSYPRMRVFSERTSRNTWKGLQETAIIGRDGKDLFLLGDILTARDSPRLRSPVNSSDEEPRRASRLPVQQEGPARTHRRRVTRKTQAVNVLRHAGSCRSRPSPPCPAAPSLRKAGGRQAGQEVPWL